MTDREKLIAKQQEAIKICGNRNCVVCVYRPKGFNCKYELIADHLIANGVTIQRWIPVEERLPDLIPCDAGTAYSEAVVIWTDNRKAMVAVWDGVDFICPASFWEAEGENITHWMPLPKPPKEVE